MSEENAKKSHTSLALCARCVRTQVTVASTMLNLRPYTHARTAAAASHNSGKRPNILKNDLRVCRVLRFACKLTEKRLRAHTMLMFCMMTMIATMTTYSPAHTAHRNSAWTIGRPRMAKSVANEITSTHCKSCGMRACLRSGLASLVQTVWRCFYFSCNGLTQPNFTHWFVLQFPLLNVLTRHFIKQTAN